MFRENNLSEIINIDINVILNLKRHISIKRNDRKQRKAKIFWKHPKNELKTWI